jgi:hypothetical protein
MMSRDDKHKGRELLIEAEKPDFFGRAFSKEINDFNIMWRGTKPDNKTLLKYLADAKYKLSFVSRWQIR